MSKTKTRWTKKALARLEKLTETMSFSEIAEKYGMKKSAIQMACNRGGVKGKQRNRKYSGSADAEYRRMLKEKRLDKAQPDPFNRRIK